MTKLFSSLYNKKMDKNKKSSKQLDYELRQMEAEMKGTVDINYEKYNNVFMDKVARHNQELKREKGQSSDQTIQGHTEEAARYLHRQAKDRNIYY